MRKTIIIDDYTCSSQPKKRKKITSRTLAQRTLAERTAQSEVENRSVEVPISRERSRIERTRKDSVSAAQPRQPSRVHDGGRRKVDKTYEEIPGLEWLRIVDMSLWSAYEHTHEEIAPEIPVVAIPASFSGLEHYRSVFYPLLMMETAAATKKSLEEAIGNSTRKSGRIRGNAFRCHLLFSDHSISVLRGCSFVTMTFRIDITHLNMALVGTRDHRVNRPLGLAEYDIVILLPEGKHKRSVQNDTFDYRNLLLGVVESSLELREQRCSIRVLHAINSHSLVSRFDEKIQRGSFLVWKLNSILTSYREFVALMSLNQVDELLLRFLFRVSVNFDDQPSVCFKRLLWNATQNRNSLALPPLIAGNAQPLAHESAPEAKDPFRDAPRDPRLASEKPKQKQLAIVQENSSLCPQLPDNIHMCRQSRLAQSSQVVRLPAHLAAGTLVHGHLDNNVNGIGIREEENSSPTVKGSTLSHQRGSQFDMQGSQQPQYGQWRSMGDNASVLTMDPSRNSLDHSQIVSATVKSEPPQEDSTGEPPDLRPYGAEKWAEDVASSPSFLTIAMSGCFNESQLRAIWTAVWGTPPIALIQGPPGTGKTRTLIALLNVIHHGQFCAFYEGCAKRILSRNLHPALKLQEPLQPLINLTKPPRPHVLVCAPSNAAVDEIARRVAKDGLVDGQGCTYYPRVLRVGQGGGADSRSVSLDEAVMTRYLRIVLDIESDAKVAVANSQVSRAIEDKFKELRVIQDRIGACMARLAEYSGIMTELKRDEQNVIEILKDMNLKMQTFPADLRNGFQETPLDANIIDANSIKDTEERLQQIAIQVQDVIRKAGIVKGNIIGEHESKFKANLEINRFRWLQDVLSGNSTIREVRKKLETSLLDEAEVVVTTLSGSALSQVANIQHAFPTVIIDEAAQAVELSTLVPLQYGVKRVVLVGDPNQLPATVFSREASRHSYDQSLFQRLMDTNAPCVMLDTQYRMHPAISKFPSKHFYGNSLKNVTRPKAILSPI
eukprot:Rmarinus@m.10855